MAGSQFVYNKIHDVPTNNGRSTTRRVAREALFLKNSLRGSSRERDKLPSPSSNNGLNR